MADLRIEGPLDTLSEGGRGLGRLPKDEGQLGADPTTQDVGQGLFTFA